MKIIPALLLVFPLLAPSSANAARVDLYCTFADQTWDGFDPKRHLSIGRFARVDTKKMTITFGGNVVEVSLRTSAESVTYLGSAESSILGKPGRVTLELNRQTLFMHSTERYKGISKPVTEQLYQCELWKPKV